MKDLRNVIWYLWYLICDIKNDFDISSVSFTRVLGILEFLPACGNRIGKIPADSPNLDRALPGIPFSCASDSRVISLLRAEGKFSVMKCEHFDFSKHWPKRLMEDYNGGSRLTKTQRGRQVLTHAFLCFPFRHTSKAKWSPLRILWDGRIPEATSQSYFLPFKS